MPVPPTTKYIKSVGIRVLFPVISDYFWRNISSTKRLSNFYWTPGLVIIDKRAIHISIYTKHWNLWHFKEYDYLIILQTLCRYHISNLHRVAINIHSPYPWTPFINLNMSILMYLLAIFNHCQDLECVRNRVFSSRNNNLSRNACNIMENKHGAANLITFAKNV